MSDLKDLIAAVERGEWRGDLPRPHALQTDLCWKAFSGSLDAARALHEALLPDAWWQIDSAVSATVYWFVGAEPVVFDAEDDSPARAWLLAILRALDAEAARDE